MWGLWAGKTVLNQTCRQNSTACLEISYRHCTTFTTRNCSLFVVQYCSSSWHLLWKKKKDSAAWNVRADWCWCQSVVFKTVRTCLWNCLAPSAELSCPSSAINSWQSLPCRCCASPATSNSTCIYGIAAAPPSILDISSIMRNTSDAVVVFVCPSVRHTPVSCKNVGLCKQHTREPQDSSFWGYCL